MPESILIPEVGLSSGSTSSSPSHNKVDYYSTMELSTSTSSSPKPVRDSSWLQVDLCRDFQRDTCPRGQTCRFAHPESRAVIVKDGKVTCCYDFLKEKCQRPLCKYYHPPMHIKEKLVCAGKQFGAMMSTAPSMVSSPSMAITTSPSYHSGSANMYGVDSTMVTPGPSCPDRIQICTDFIMGCCTALICPYAHPGPYVRHNIDQTVTVCHNFMKWGCARGEGCRFYHPLSHQVWGPMMALQGYYMPGQSIPAAAPFMPLPHLAPMPMMYSVPQFPFSTAPESPVMQGPPTSGLMPLPANGGVMAFPPPVYSPPLSLPYISQPHFCGVPVNVIESAMCASESSIGMAESEA